MKYAALRRDLALAGWGVLSGQHQAAARDALQALTILADEHTGICDAGLATIAAMCCRGITSTRKGLLRLEYLGLITWDRGDASRRDRQVSRFTVHKHRLLQVISAAHTNSQRSIEL